MLLCLGFEQKAIILEDLVLSSYGMILQEIVLNNHKEMKASGRLLPRGYTGGKEKIVPFS